MPKTSPQSKIPAGALPPTPTSRPRYQRPKILLLDMGGDAKETLEKEGYNVAVGTFGRPYKVEKSSNYKPVVVQPRLPNYTEQEIVVVDLIPGEPEEVPPAEKMTPPDELDMW